MARQALTVKIALIALAVVAVPALGQDAGTFTEQGVHGPVRAQRIATGLVNPSALEWLGDGRLLVAERAAARLRVLDVGTGQVMEISGLPDIVTGNDAGLHDLERHPAFAQNGWLYFSYSAGRPELSTLEVARARLVDATLVDIERILLADAWSQDLYHYGGRLQFSGGHLFVTVGDRHRRERAQELSNHAGAILRLYDDGRVPADNPFVDRAGALPETWAYGSRNAQGFFVDPVTGQAWLNEHGPRHGDELNRLERGANYGWPVVSFGWEYDGGPIGRGIVREEGMSAPEWVWTPAIGPSDLLVYRGDAFPAWQGSLLSGGMSRPHLNRLELGTHGVRVEERLLDQRIGRIRSLALDLQGRVYLGTDNGEVWQLAPD